MRSGTTAAAKDYMEVHEAMSSGSVMLTLSQKQKNYSNSRVREGRKGVAPFVRLICIDGESTARAGGAVENVLRLPKLVFRPFWFVRRRRGGGGRYL